MLHITPRKEGVARWGPFLFPGNRYRTRGDGLMLHRWSFRLDTGGNFFLRKGGNGLVQTEQGGGEVTIPGGVQQPWRCDTEGRGHWVWWGGDGWTR